MSDASNDRRKLRRRHVIGSSVEILAIGQRRFGAEERLPVSNVSEGGIGFVRAAEPRSFFSIFHRKAEFELGSAIHLRLHIPPFLDSAEVTGFVRHVHTDERSGHRRIGVELVTPKPNTLQSLRRAVGNAGSSRRVARV